MVFAFLSSLFSTAPKAPVSTVLDTFYQTLWLSKRTDWVLTLIAQLYEIDQTAPASFMARLQESHVTAHSSTIIKQLLITYPKPEQDVCKQVSLLLVTDSCVGVACATAIGNEKHTYNKQFYHKIRVLKGLEQGDYRKLLTEIKGSVVTSPPLASSATKYTLGLFNEPIPHVVKNPSDKHDIMSVYKGYAYRNKILRTPIELPLDIPFVQKDFHLFAEVVGDEPMVIVVRHIGPDVVVPKGYFLVFVESTKSFGERILPFVDGITESNLLDVIGYLNE